MLSKLLNCLKCIRSRLMALIASLFDDKLQTLPQTRDDLEVFTTTVLERAGLNVADDSYRHNVAAQIMQLNKDVDKVRKSAFVQQIRRYIANQVAYGMIDDIKNALKAKEDQEARNAEKARNS